MTLHNPVPGFNFLPAYQAPGLPWVASGTASNTAPTRFDFPFVSKSIIVSNNSAVGSLLRIGYTADGIAGTRYFLLDGKQIVELPVRVKEIYLQGDAGSIAFGLHANLSFIESRQMLPLSGSGVSLSGSYYWTGV